MGIFHCLQYNSNLRVNLWGSLSLRSLGRYNFGRILHLHLNYLSRGFNHEGDSPKCSERAQNALESASTPQAPPLPEVSSIAWLVGLG